MLPIIITMRKIEIIIRLLVLNIYLLTCVFQFCEMAGKKRTALSTQQKCIFKSHTLFLVLLEKNCFKSFSLQSQSLGRGERAGPTFCFCIFFCTRIWWILAVFLKMRSQLKIKIPNMNETSKGFCGAHPVDIQTANITLFSFTVLNFGQYNSIVWGQDPFSAHQNPRVIPSGYHQKFFVDGKANPGVTEPNEGMTITHRGGSVSLWPSKDRQKQAVQWHQHVLAAKPPSWDSAWVIWCGRGTSLHTSVSLTW